METKQRPLTDIELVQINAKLRYKGYDELYPDQVLAAREGGEQASGLLEDLAGRIGIELPRSLTEKGAKLMSDGQINDIPVERR